MQARTVLNVSAAYHDEKGRWSVTPWIANVGNKIYRVAALPVAGLWNFTNYGAPRSYGVTANFRFE
jgi:iron complex outermembrane receptor protein